MAVPEFRLEEEEVRMVCSYRVEEEEMSELDIKWYLDWSPAPWLVHLPHHWALPQVVAGTRLSSHVSQAGNSMSGF